MYFKGVTLCVFLIVFSMLTSVIVCQECGKTFVPPRSLIFDGEKESYGGTPWHVAIYRLRDLKLICGGTIISSRVIMSAAHCFYNAQKMNKVNNPDSYEIVVSKFTLNYNNTDNAFQKSYKVKEIRILSSYQDIATYFADDIALLILYNNIKMSNIVLPACLDLNTRFNVPERSLGKAGGLMKKVPSETLTVANLPFISYASCLESYPEDEKKAIAEDKFCGGGKTGSGLNEGDSGGGFVFLEPASKSYYIRGIVSSRINGNENARIAIFTNVSAHIEWIKSVLTEVRKEAGSTRCDMPGREEGLTFKVGCEPGDPYIHRVPDSCILTATCNGYTFYSTCKEGTWNPTIPSCESSSKPPEEGSILVRNKGGYVAKFSVQYKLLGEQMEKESGKFTLGVNKELKIPIGATDISLKVEQYWFINSLTTILTRFYTEPVRECFEIYGTTLNPQFSQVSCS